MKNDWNEWDALAASVEEIRMHSKPRLIDRLLAKRTTWAIVSAMSILSTTWFLATDQPLIGLLSMHTSFAALLIGICKDK